MSTNSTIAKLNNDGSVDVIYCHWDGYLEHNGKILKDHYTDPDKIDKLISLGNLSILGENIEPVENKPHSFEKPLDDVCVYYGRDRGEINVESKHYDSFDVYQQHAHDQEFNYIFKDGKWLYSDNNLNNFIEF